MNSDDLEHRPEDAGAEGAGAEDAATQRMDEGDATLEAEPGTGPAGTAEQPGSAARSAARSTGPGSLSGVGSLPRSTAASFSSRYGDRHFLSAGGMGEVMVVKDLRVGRDLAMKVMRTSAQRSPEAGSRFVREARVQGRLEHPSVVPVHDLGMSPDGEPYFVMKRIRGQTLKAILEERAEGVEATLQKYPRRVLLRGLSQLCLALDFAHSKGIVHRDLKPANIMLGDFGEVYLLDWGIAKVRGTGDSVEPFVESGEGDGEAGQTKEGAVIGTPGYAAPEQLGEQHLVDARTDVYGMGVVLFELLAAEPLHANRAAVGKILVETYKGMDASPARRAPGRDIPPELDAITQRACQRDPAQRFPHMRALHDALEDYLAGERDAALRGELADGHEAAAAAAATRALSAGDQALGARREAIQEVGKALALRPGSRPALQTLVQLMTAPPAQLPPPVAKKLEAEAEEQVRSGFRMGRWVYATWLTVLPMALCMGIRDWAPMVLGMVTSAGAVVTCVLGTRNPRVSYQYLLVTLTAITMMLASRLLGVFLIIPTVLGVNAVSFALTHLHRRRIWFTSILTSALVVPLALELAGVLSPSYAFVDGKMVVLPNVVSLPAVPTLTLLGIIAFATVWVSAFWAGKVRDLLWSADTRIALGSWQLEQLMPSSPGAPDSPDSSET